LKIAVIGANGQLGADVVSVFERKGDTVARLCHSDIELSSMESVRGCLGAQPFDCVINTAAMHHVENCEQDPSGAFAVNALGARNLALATRETGAVLVHVSTDYVFDGAKREPYVERDAARPLNVYGNSKLAGEYFVRTLNPRHYVLRTSALYGEHACRAKGGRNFVELMLHLGRERGRVKVVNDEFVTPTPTVDVARQIAALTDHEAFGLYHATAEGSCTWYEFALEIFAAAGLSVEVLIAAPGDFPAKVPRPSYSVLANHRLNEAGLNLFRPWQTGLTEYLAKEVSVGI
jgi:dTDP-4-dehydrorhamnose reductase